MSEPGGHDSRCASLGLNARAAPSPRASGESSQRPFGQWNCTRETSRCRESAAQHHGLAIDAVAGDRISGLLEIPSISAHSYRPAGARWKSGLFLTAKTAACGSARARQNAGL